MTLTVITGHRLEDLFDMLLEEVTSAPAHPMDSETIVVPGQGIARWLELRIAARTGVAAGIETPFLSSYLSRLSAPSDHRNQTFTREAMVLRLWRLISERLHSKDAKLTFGTATDYCIDDKDGRKRLQLCNRLATCFANYQLYRDDLLSDFAKGTDHIKLSPHAQWQGRMWRALLEDAGLELPRKRSGKQSASDATPLLFSEMASAENSQRPSSDVAHQFITLRSRLSDASWCQRNLPRRLFVFGATTMPPAFLESIHRISEHISVHLYVPQPTPHFVGDLHAKTSRAGDNALLARFGAESREFQGMLVDLDDRCALDSSVERIDIDGLSSLEAPETLLACVQSDVVNAYDRGESNADRFQLSPHDESLRVHDCHSAQRELEVVRDQIFAALEADPSLEARDFMVLVPNIDAYAPYAQAVFGPVQYYLPFHVADRHPALEMPVCRTVLAVLELANTRLTLADVLHVLENPAVQTRFGLFAADVPTLRQLCQQAGICWGLDGDSRHKQFDLPAFDDNSWLQGLDRLLLGTLTGPVDEMVLGTLPVGDTTEGRTELLQRFTSFVHRLFDHVRQLREPASFTDWSVRIDRIVEELIQASDVDQENAVKQLKRAMASLRTVVEVAEHTEAVSLSVARDWLYDALAQGSPSRGFLGGSITIAAMMPMRAVPVRCLFVCGLDDESFPRGDHPVAFDLIAAKPRPGDRNRRLDDRQLFLDLLLSARDRLHLSFIGHSAKDNAERAPSIVLTELFEHVDRIAQSPDQIAPHRYLQVCHPLQPWSHHYRGSTDARLFTYMRDASAMPLPNLSRPEAQPWCSDSFAVPAAAGAFQSDQDVDTAGLTTLSVEDLLNFWGHPCQAFLRNALRLRISSDNDQDEADEPFGLDGLTRYKLQDEAVSIAKQGVIDREDALACTRAKGVLPVGYHGDATFEHLRAESVRLVEEAQRFTDTDSVPIDLQIGNVRIVGAIEGVGAEEVICIRAGKLKPKDRLRAWILHLVVAIQRDRESGNQQIRLPTTTRLVATDGVWAYQEVSVEVACEQLKQLLAFFYDGHTRPLPYFEKASFAVGMKLSKNSDDAMALSTGLKAYRMIAGKQFATPDEADASIALCMRDRDPFEQGIKSEFFSLAQAVWLAPIDCLQEIE